MIKEDAVRVVRLLVALPFALLALIALTVSTYFLAGTIWVATSRAEAQRFLNDIRGIGA